MFDDVAPIAGGDFISYGEYRNFKKMRPFKITGDTEELILIDWSDDVALWFYEYFEIWENTKEFGLPTSSVWTGERPWTIDFLKYFNRVYNEVENWRATERQRKGR